MQSRRKTGREESPPPSPPPGPSARFLRDVSNYKTPKPYTQNPNLSEPQSPLPIFFTASKKTPFSSRSTTTPVSAFRRRTPLVPPSHSKAARRLKALELEQSRSSRKTQIRREKVLKSFSRSMSAWLNFLFQNPMSCGCNVSAGFVGRFDYSNRKRERLEGGGRVGVSGIWRSPKRQRNSIGDGEEMVVSSIVPALQVSLQEVCSFEDLEERMAGYLSSKGCNEVFSIMRQVAKNIDEGRLKMNAHCPLVTDVGLKKKAIRVLMCYHPMWLRIGLHIVFGGDSLLQDEESSDTEDRFLKMIIEKQFFSHGGLAKSYAYNKLVEGLYRPGYFEALGSVILKRFLLLVLLLDKAKSESTLPVKYGIDSIDGGSPLLFCRLSYIKSSRQVIHEFLSEVMHGEGDLLAHLFIVGYKVTHQQSPLSEFDFNVTSTLEDLQDGLVLCRAIQLLKCDASIISKVMAPSDTRKKNMHNCILAMQYLKEAGVPLADEDGVVIVAEDVVSGDKELTISMLWNMFLHLQLPLFIDKIMLVEEIAKVKRLNVGLSNCNHNSHMGLLLEWIQAVAESYSISVENFSSLVNGKALCYLVDYYFKNELRGFVSLKETQDMHGHKLFSLTCTEDTDAAHNFVLVQRVINVLGNFPEVLQTSDILDQDTAYDERSVIILLIFLASLLICRRNMDPHNIYKAMQLYYRSLDVKHATASHSPQTVNCLFNNYRPVENCILDLDAVLKDDGLESFKSEDAVVLRKIKVIQTWWHAITVRNHFLKIKFAASIIQQAIRCHLTKRHMMEMRRERAAKVIQSHARGSTERKIFLRIKTATYLLQTVTRAWLTLTRGSPSTEVGPACFDLQICSESLKFSGIYYRYLNSMIERHRFLKMKKSVILIQKAIRVWIRKGHQRNCVLPSEAITLADTVNAATTLQSYIRGQKARSKYVSMLVQLPKNVAICIQLKGIEHQNRAAVMIQLAWRNFYLHKFIFHQCSAAIIIQTYWRGWLTRRKCFFQLEAIIKIQNVLRCLKCQKAYQQKRLAAIEIQRLARGWVTRRRLLGASSLRSGKLHYGPHFLIKRNSIENMQLKLLVDSTRKVQRWWKHVLFLKSIKRSAIIIQSYIRGWTARKEASRARRSISVIQNWWRNTLFLKSRVRSSLIIQSHVRVWIARRQVIKERNRIIVIQSYWKGYLVRKGSRQKLLDLRCRLQKSMANIDDDMRLINRLVAALSELLDRKSISNIRHICATLDMATKHSQKCCETLVAAGVINILLKEIHLLTRSGPDQEVTKLILSTLRNIVCYQDLAQTLINTPLSVETIFQELLRNKNEGFFIACELLKRLCATKEGLEATQKLRGHVRRFHSLVRDLERKAEMQKRNARLGATVRAVTEERLGSASSLLQLIINAHS